jgi:glycosyltransferase 2 family protein
MDIAEAYELIGCYNQPTLRMEVQRLQSIWSRIGIGLVLGLLVIVGLLLFADIHAVAHVITVFHWSYVPLILSLTLFNYALRFLKWHYYIHLIGAKTIGWRDSLRIFIGGFPLALSPGKIAEPIKAVWLKHYTDVPVARGIPVVIAERISDGLAVLLLSTLGVIAYPQYWPGFVIVLAGLLAIVIISQIRPLALWMLSLGERLPIVSRFSRHLHEFYESMYQLFGFKSTFIAVGLGMVSWLGEGIGFYLVLRGLGLPPSIQTASIAVFVLSFSTVIGAASSLPGGLGAAEVSIAGMLTLTLRTPEAIAASATLLIRFFTLWFGVTLGLVVLFASRRLLMLNLPVDRVQSATSEKNSL